MPTSRTIRLLPLFGLFLAAPLTVGAQTPLPQDTTPAAVVQRFVDGANAADVGAMMATVAPGVVFFSLPAGIPMVTGRDSLRVFYERVLSRLPAGHKIEIASRIVDGAYVVDLEKFTSAGGKSEGQATWAYLVTGGLIQQAWALRKPRPAVTR